MAEEAKQEEKKPVPLKDVSSLTAERDKAIVDVLESFIEMAKDGLVSDIAIVCKVKGQSRAEIEWDTDDGDSLIGALERAKYQVADHLNAEDEDEDNDD